MRAIVVHALGGPDVLVLGSTDVPRPASGELLVRLHAIGINFSDTERRRGTYDPPPRWGLARRELQRWVLDGRLRVTLGQTLPLAEAAEAHRRLEQRQTQGKLLLVP